MQRRGEVTPRTRVHSDRSPDSRESRTGHGAISNAHTQTERHTCVELLHDLVEVEHPSTSEHQSSMHRLARLEIDPKKK